MSLLYETESQTRIRVYEEPDGKRILRLGNGSEIHSMWDPAQVLIDVYEENYWNYFSLLPSLMNKPENVLIVGLGAGTIARQLQHYHPALQIDGVEIDPEIVRVGREYFELGYQNLNVHITDGLQYLATCTKKYDIVILDAFKGGNVNKAFLTSEVFSQIKGLLKPKGIFSTNYYEGLAVPTLMKRCLAKTFDHIQRVPIPNTYNFLVVASLEDVDLKQPARLIKDKELLRIARYVSENILRDK